MKTLFLLFVFLPLLGFARQVTVVNHTNVPITFAFESSGGDHRPTVGAYSTVVLSLTGDAYYVVSAWAMSQGVDGSGFPVTQYLAASNNNVLQLNPDGLSYIVRIRFVGVSSSPLIEFLASPYLIPEGTPSITDSNWQSAMAAGFSVWILPLSAVALLRFARKGSRAGGTVL